MPVKHLVFRLEGLTCKWAAMPVIALCNPTKLDAFEKNSLPTARYPADSVSMIPMRRDKNRGARFERWEFEVNLPKVHFWQNIPRTPRQAPRACLRMKLTS